MTVDELCDKLEWENMIRETNDLIQEIRLQDYLYDLRNFPGYKN